MKKKYTFAFSLIFCIVVSIPFWGMIFYKPKETNEKRNLMEFKEIRSPRQFDKYLMDNHAFRDELSGMYFTAFINALDESPNQGKVEYGKDGYFFLGDEESNSYSRSLGVVKLDAERLDNACEQVFKMKMFCDSLNIGFYFSIAPNKETVYPEYLRLKPSAIQREKGYMISLLKEKYGICAIDLADCILSKKKDANLYYRNDTHWNTYGAFLAVKQITDIVKINCNKIAPICEEDYVIERIPPRMTSGDLVDMLKIESLDEDYSIKRKQPMDIEITETSNIGVINTMHTRNRNNESGANAFIIRDSFFTSMFSTFSESLQNGTYFWMTIFDKELILANIETNGKPDFILYEITERGISTVKCE